MLTHLIILLDDTSVSYCHYRSSKDRRLIDLGDLKTGIVWAMKENLNIQFVYSDDELPDAYLEAIDSIDHVDIRSASHSDTKLEKCVSLRILLAGEQEQTSCCPTSEVINIPLTRPLQLLNGNHASS